MLGDRTSEAWPGPTGQEIVDDILEASRSAGLAAGPPVREFGESMRSLADAMAPAMLGFQVSISRFLEALETGCREEFTRPLLARLLHGRTVDVVPRFELQAVLDEANGVLYVPPGWKGPKP